MSDETPDFKPMSSPANDIRKLRTNSAATASELLGWLSKMRGKSPQEVLGTVATSSLFKSLITATLLMAVLILGWTAIAWGYDQFIKEAEQEAVANETNNNNTTQQPEPQATKNVENPDKAAMPELDLSKKQKIADDLGIGETKEAPKNSNPLDDTNDDLLKGLE